VANVYAKITNDQDRLLYFDSEIGVIIASDSLWTELQLTDDRLNAKVWEIGNPTFAIGPPVARTAVLPDPQPGWYLHRLGGWPQLTGKGIRVAVIDSGLDSSHKRHQRPCPDPDFESMENPKASCATDFGSHGTNCAGLIGARILKNRRIASAPECELIVCQHSSSTEPGRITAVDFLLLATWAVKHRSARIISFSYGTTIEAVREHIDPRKLGIVARRWRKQDRALIFCSAGNTQDTNRTLQLPAGSRGFVAVSGYRPLLDQKNIVADTLLSGFGIWPPVNPDFLLGPSVKLLTTGPKTMGNDDYLQDFGDTSGACAYVAGLAALYLERYPRMTLDQVLLKMQCDAERVPDERGGDWEWRGVRFPS
jgi:subtilisin family serine protease